MRDFVTGGAYEDTSPIAQPTCTTRSSRTLASSHLRRLCPKTPATQPLSCRGGARSCVSTPMHIHKLQSQWNSCRAESGGGFTTAFDNHDQSPCSKSVFDRLRYTDSFGRRCWRCTLQLKHIEAPFGHGVAPWLAKRKLPARTGNGQELPTQLEQNTQQSQSHILPGHGNRNALDARKC